MKKHILLVAILALIFTGCVKNDYDFESGKDVDGRSPEDIVLQDRDSRLSTVLSKPLGRSLKTRSIYMPAEEYLGYSYRVGNADIGDNTNVGHSVIDIGKLKTKHSTYVTHHRVRAGERGHNAYLTFDNFVEHHVKYRKIKSGFSLNIGQFRLGKKTTVETRFTNYRFDQNTETLGEFWFELYHGRHTMQRGAAATRNIATGFLHADFMDALYNQTKSELLDDFGPFVITDYFSGGRAHVMFYGETSDTQEAKVRERKMNTEITASVSWSGNTTQDSISGNFSVGRNVMDTVGYKCEFKTYLFSLRTRGGAYTIETPAQPVLGNAINMNDWLVSLNNSDTHTLSGFVDEGLSFIGDFILEENFRGILQDTYQEERKVEQHVLPRMEILKVFVRTASNGESLYEVAPILRLRENEWLIMSDGSASSATDAELRANNNNATFMAKAKAIYAEKSQFYQCEILTNPTKTINPYVKRPLSYQITRLDEGRMKKFYNADTGMYYIYDSVALVAFAYYMDDYILESYGLLDWADGLQEKAISMTNLAQRYRVFGL